MAAQLPVVGTMKLICHGTMGGNAVINVFHWRADTPAPFTSSTLGIIAGALRTAYVSNFIPHIHTKYTLGEVEAIDLSSDLGLSAVTPGSTPGTGLGASPPASLAQCVTWTIGRRYRGGHPRTYLPPPGDVAFTDSPNSWDPDHVTAMQTAANNFRVAMIGSLGSSVPGRLVCVHRVRTNSDGVVETLNPPLTDPLIDSSFDSRMDTQRRRLGRDR